MEKNNQYETPKAESMTAPSRRDTWQEPTGSFSHSTFHELQPRKEGLVVQTKRDEEFKSLEKVMSNTCDVG